MANKKEASFAKFHLRSVEIYESSLTKQTQGFSVKNFSFNINLENRVDHVNKVIQVECSVRVTGDDATTLLGTLSAGCTFEVLNFDDVVKIKEDKSIDVLPDLTHTLNSITLSTTRGIMFSQFRGTFLHFAHLPIMDMSVFRPLLKDSIKS